MSDHESGSGIECVMAGKEHVAGMAVCYAAAFPRSLVVILGEYFTKGLCRTFVRSRGGFGMVAVDKENRAVAGMVIGGDPGLRGRYFAARGVQVLAVAAWKFTTSSAARRRLWYHVRDFAVQYHILNPRRYSRAPTAPKSGLAVLQALCVRPDFRRLGIGRRLTEMLVAECARRGYTKIRLTTESDNTAAIKLYTGCGWKLIGGRGNMRYFSLQVGAGPMDKK